MIPYLPQEIINSIIHHSTPYCELDRKVYQDRNRILRLFSFVDSTWNYLATEELFKAVFIDDTNVNQFCQRLTNRDGEAIALKVKSIIIMTERVFPVELLLLEPTTVYSCSTIDEYIDVGIVERDQRIVLDSRVFWPSSVVNLISPGNEYYISLSPFRITFGNLTRLALAVSQIYIFSDPSFFPQLRTLSIAEDEVDDGIPLSIASITLLAPQIEVLQFIVATPFATLYRTLPLFTRLKHFAINTTTRLDELLLSSTATLQSIQLVTKEDYRESSEEELILFEEILLNSKAKCLAKINNVFISGLHSIEVISKLFVNNKAVGKEVQGEEKEVHVEEKEVQVEEKEVQLVPGEKKDLGFSSKEKPYLFNIQGRNVNLKVIEDLSTGIDWRQDLTSLEGIEIDV